ncbi:hypothetical protein JHU38_10900 [Prevotella sp. A2931]|uniref:Uncharacterized protein n=1 Tax=Prevotella illustrans TaxID=2800387 RepID=A0ABS3M7W0_9BACT|nr:hypothetical protein [Prevotella illustrans]PTL26732.1 hypothetical protein C3V39_06570 [Prevotella sp. oral taxon 820]
MERKKYIVPAVEVIRMASENIMLEASPGVGGDYDPSLPIGAKRNGVFLEDEEEDIAYQWPNYRLWDE